jgi:AhpD family alkylhydroperoxidase
VDDSDLEKIEKIIEDRKAAHAFFGKKSKTYRSFVEVERNAFRDGRLTKMQKELIATGISVVINCESCMEFHISEALRMGATVEDVMEAIDVAIEMGGGPATVSARFAMKVLQYREEKKEAGE